MTKYLWVIAAALPLVSIPAGDAAEMVSILSSEPSARQATSQGGRGFDGLVESKLAELAARLNAEARPGALDALLGYAARDNQGPLDARPDRARHLPGMFRFDSGEPAKQRQIELRVPLTDGAALTSGYEASRLDVGLGGTDGDVGHEFRVGASLRF